MRAFTSVLMGLVLIICTSCGGGGGPTSPSGQSEGITGPTSIIEGSSAQFSVGRSASSPAQYQWTVSPVTLGAFSKANSPDTGFNAGYVTKDTQIELIVSIVPENGSPAVLKTNVTIKDKADEGPAPQPNGNPPIASAQADPQSVNPGGYIQFRDNSIDPDGNATIVKRQWDFTYDTAVGFHIDSEENEPYVQYPNKGDFFVQLKVTDASGNWDMLDAPIHVLITNDPLDPVAKALCYPNPGPVCEPIQFQNNGSYPRSGDSIIKYEWDWNNDGIYDEEGLFAYHTWDVPGTYNVQFRVTDNTGRKGTLSNPLLVVVDQVPPIAVADADKYSIREGQTVTFDAGNSNDPDCDGEIVLCEWDWENDGIYDDTGSYLTHLFENAGIFHVMLRVTDDEGESAVLGTPLIINVDPGLSRIWGGSGSDAGYDVFIDDNGDIFIAGTFSGTVDFDPGTGVDERTATGSSSAFLAKFDQNSAYQWVTTWSDGNYSSANGLFVSTPGYIYVAGTTALIKFNPFGDILWEYDNGCIGEGVAVDDYTGVYITGHFIPYGHTYSDIFISKLDYDGNLIWEHNLGGLGCDQAFDIDIDSTGRPLVVGHFENSVDFDPSDGTDVHTAVGSTDSFVSKFDGNGGFMWCKVWDATNAYSMDIDPDNNIYVTGYYEGWTDFDPGPDVVSYSNTLGSYLSKFDSAGGLMWAAGWAEYTPPPPPPPWPPCGDPGYSVACDQSGNVYVAGSFITDVDFDPTGGQDIEYGGGAYLTQYSSDGNYQRVHTWGAHYDTGWDNAYAVAIGSNGNPFVTGDFGNSCDFGMDNEESRVSNGENDAYLYEVLTELNW